MTKRVVDGTCERTRTRRWRGQVLPAALVFLVWASCAAAQPAVGADAASSGARPPERESGMGSSVTAGSDGLRFQLTLKFLTGVPVGRFGSGTGISPGGAIDFTVRVGQTPLWLGVAVDYLRYGTETRRIALYPAVPEVFSDVDTTNALVRSHALVRLGFSGGRIRPYAEGLLGFSEIFTHTSIGEEGYEASTRHLGDFGLSYGAGGGVTIELASSARVRVALDIGLRYVTGGEVDYLTPGALQRDGNGVTFESVRSRVTLFDVQTGIAFGF